MNADDMDHGTTVAELRRAFDRSFAEAPAVEPGAHDDLLDLRIGSDSYAVCLADAGGLFADTRVTPLPGSVTEMCGVVGLRGAILPVYDLRALLGYAKGRVPRWLLVIAHTPVALAFDGFEGHLRVPRAAIASVPDRTVSGRSRHIHHIVRTDTCARPIIHMASVLEAIAVLAGQRVRSKE
jgi:purine-binding chemotaxis protein CheW